MLMIKHYLLIALRSARRHQYHTALNLAGLSLGLGVCLVISSFIWKEIHFDAFHANADRLVVFKQFETSLISGSGFAPLLEREIAGIEQVTRLMPYRPLLTTPDQNQYAEHFFFADSTFFELMDAQWVAGDPSRALYVPYGIVLTRSAADRYFPGKNPLGEVLTFQMQADLVVTGVIENWPEQSTLRADFLANGAQFTELTGKELGQYWDGVAITYLLLASQASLDQLGQLLPGVIESLQDPNSAVWKPEFIPLRNLYLYHRLQGPLRSAHAVDAVRVFAGIAVLVLLLACFNYVNFATARASIRAKEVGLRKVMGAYRNQLANQFLGESFLFLAVAALLGLFVAEFSLPIINQWLGEQLSLHFLREIPVMATAALSLLVLGLVTGLYPSLVLSGLRPSESLKKQTGFRTGGAAFRKVLVTLQFVVSIAIISATLVINGQIRFVQEKDLGYTKEQVLTLSFPSDIRSSEKNAFKTEVLQRPGVLSATICSQLPGTGSYYNKMVSSFLPSPDVNPGIEQLFIDPEFLQTFEIPLIEGRNFDAQHQPGGAPVFLVNREALRKLEWEQGVGRQIGYYTYQYQPGKGYEEVPVIGEVIGVVEDHHQSYLKTPIGPMLFVLQDGWANQMAIRLVPGTDIRKEMGEIGNLWEKMLPGYPFEFQFLDEAFARNYQRDGQLMKLLMAFSLLAIAISCMGLLGLAAFNAERRTKEIGIRKVLGADRATLFRLLSQDLLVCVAVANLFAWPLAWAGTQEWLNFFVYRISPQWWMFALAGLAALLVSGLVVALQVRQAAHINPVHSLKTE